MIDERMIDVEGVRTRLLEQQGPGPEHPVLMVHGSPTNADDWRPFMQALEGKRRCLAADLPGWGRSDRSPPAPHTMDALATHLGQLLDVLEVGRFDLVMHDWGGLALITAQRRAEATGRMVIINTVALVPGYKWHWAAQLWRRRVVGELLTATTTRSGMRLGLRQATPRKGTLPEVADRAMEHWDRGMRRALLELYRDADPDKLEVAGRDLGSLRGPSLVLWGDSDPYIEPRFADLIAKRLGGEVTVEHLPDAGHWAWLDRPDIIDRTAAFLSPSA